MASSPFKNINIDRDKIDAALLTGGCEEVSYLDTAPNEKLYTVKFKDADHLFRIYALGGGGTTIGKIAGQCPETFEHLAKSIVEGCKYSDSARLELSVPIEADKLNDLFDYLAEEVKAVKEEQQTKEHWEQYRWRGPKGDTLVVKAYSNGNVQFQGKGGHLAVRLNDYLCNVLSVDVIIQNQLETYRVPLTVKDIRSELSARMPVSDTRLNDLVKKQFSSALTLSKIDVPIEDYTFVVFPALKGMEGVLKQLLVEAGCDAKNNLQVGEYLEINPKDKFGKYVIRGIYQKVFDPKYVKPIEQAYNYFHDQRHQLFHMNWIPIANRILENRTDATNIVDQVMELVETAFAALPKPR